MAEEPTRDELIETNKFFAALLMVVATENGGKRIVDLRNYTPGTVTFDRDEDIVTISVDTGKAN